MKSATEIKKLALGNLKGKWNQAFFISFLFIFIMTTLFLLDFFTWFNNFLNLVVVIAIFVITLPLLFGYLASLYKLYKKEKISYFDNFKFSFLNFKKSWTILGNIILKIIPLFVVYLITTFVLATGTTFLTDSGFLLTDNIDFVTLSGNARNGLVTLFYRPYRIYIMLDFIYT